MYKPSPARFWLATAILTVAVGVVVVVAVGGNWRKPPVTSGFISSPLTYTEDIAPDVYFCMRVTASPSEVAQFLSREFTVSQRIAVPVDDQGVGCALHLGLSTFAAKTIAHEEEESHGHALSWRGAVYQDGTLFYWDIAD